MMLTHQRALFTKFVRTFTSHYFPPKQTLLSLLENEVQSPPIANAIFNSADKLKKLLDDWNSNPAQTNGKAIVGSVPMPLELINRLDSSDLLTYESNDQVQPSASLFNFIIRRHYQPLYEKCNNRKRNGVIGTPGIAKSVSLLFPLLLHISKTKNDPNGPPVVLHSCWRKRAFIFFNDSCWEIPGFSTSNPNIVSIINTLRNYPGLLYLADGPAPTHPLEEDLSTQYTRTILASSPGWKNYNEFLKQGKRFMMPHWELEELLQARELVNPNVTETQVLERYKQVGGVIRGVLTSEESAKDYFELLQSALEIEKSNPSAMILKVDAEEGLKTKDIGTQGLFSHKIYFFDVDPTTFETTKVIFASDWVKSNLASIRFNKLKEAYHNEKSSKDIGSVVGFHYEQYVFSSWQILPDGEVNVKVRLNASGHTKEKSYKCGTLRKDAPPIRTPKDFCEHVKNLLCSKYNDVTVIKVTSQTFPVIDFAVFDHSQKHLLLVQATINKGKRINANNLKEFDELLSLGINVELLIVTDTEGITTVPWNSKDLLGSEFEKVKAAWQDKIHIAYYH